MNIYTIQICTLIGCLLSTYGCTSEADNSSDQALVYCENEKNNILANDYSNIKYSNINSIDYQGYWYVGFDDKTILVPKKLFDRIFLRENNGIGTIFLSEGYGLSPSYRFSVQFPTKHNDYIYKNLLAGLGKKASDIACDKETLAQDLDTIDSIKVKNSLLSNIGKEFIGDRRHLKKVGLKLSNDELVVAAYHQDKLVSYQEYINTSGKVFIFSYSLMHQKEFEKDDAVRVHNQIPSWMSKFFFAISENTAESWESFFHYAEKAQFNRHDLVMTYKQIQKYKKPIN